MQIGPVKMPDSLAAWSIAVASVTTVPVQVSAQDAHPTCETQHSGCESSFSVYLEEDNLQLNSRVLSPHTDRNYTMGFGLSRGGSMIRDQHHDFVLNWVDRTVGALLYATLGRIGGLQIPNRLDLELNSTARPKAYSELFAGTAFTPESLAFARIIRGDRPYAFLLGWTVRRSTLMRPNTAVTTDVTVGTVGSRLGRNAQRFIHRRIRGPTPCDSLTAKVGPCDPKGWGNQIHDVPSLWGGVPTMRYEAFVEHRLFGPFKSKIHCARYAESLIGLGAEAGYYTDAYASARLRLGYFSSPFYAWWQNPLSTGNVLNSESAKPKHKSPNLGREECTINPRFKPPKAEAFLYAGVRPRVWAYNLLLQGYPGYKGYAFSSSDVRHTQTDGEVGLTVAARLGSARKSGVELTWELLGHKSAEFVGAKARGHAWGGAFLTVTHDIASPKL
jgi:hypothetical protein